MNARSRSRSVRPAALFFLLALVALLPAFAVAPTPGSSVNPYFPVLDLIEHPPTTTLKMLNVAAFQQTTEFTCGSSVVLTLCRFWGRTEDEMAIASATHCVPGSGTHPLAMLSWLKKHDFVVWGGEGPTLLAAGKNPLNMLRRSNALGLPVIVEWTDWGGHYALVAGYDDLGTPDNEDDDVIVLADPYDHHDGSVDGLTIVNAQRFLSMWFDARCFGRLWRQTFFVAVPRERANAVVAVHQLQREFGKNGHAH